RGNVMPIILLIIAICFGISLIGKVFGLVKKFFKVLLAIGGICLYLYFCNITFPITAVVVAIWLLVKLCRKIGQMREKKRQQKILKENRKANKAWIVKNAVQMEDVAVDELLYPAVEKIAGGDKNSSDYKFTMYELPFGRVNSFLNYFGKSIFNEEVYYFSAKPSKDKNEFREYGTLIARTGIYKSVQYLSGEKYICKDFFIPFAGVRKVNPVENRIEALVIDKETYDYKKYVMDSGDFDVSSLAELFRVVIENRINAAIIADKIIDTSYADVTMKKAERNFSNAQAKTGATRTATVSGVASSVHKMEKTTFAEVKNYMNSTQGGGYAAEYVNNTFDRVLGKRVQGEDRDVSGRQAKHGADRTVNGVQIQTKFYRTARESVNAAFENQQAIYLRTDGSGKMMQIEVPSDQYQEALRVMQQKIDSGQVPNVEPGESAKNYVRKSYFTYTQANNVALAGSVEGLAVDISSGLVASRNAGGISAMIVFAQSVWAGDSLRDSAKAGLEAGFRVVTFGTMVNVLSMQLSRDRIINPFKKVYTADHLERANASIDNPIAKLADNMAETISSSDFAHSTVGKTLGLDQLDNKALIGSTASMVMLFGPDIWKTLNGRISSDQLIKNSAVAAGQVVGAGIGLAVIPIVGGFIGGSIGNFVVKNILDNYIEDDAVKMFQILKEEFIDVVSMSHLNKEELDKVVNDTISNPELSKILENMYMSGEYREYARISIINASVVNVLSEREKITTEMIEEGYGEAWLELTA
ncbi:MAG: hypothetical protein LUE86_07890, partial [Clostridiales bacterium]|nr:hypothetical protein [Clostridiales bacterium]